MSMREWKKVQILPWKELGSIQCIFGYIQSERILEEILNACGSIWRKEKDLPWKQKDTLEMFLEHGAISQAQYDKNLSDLTEKMGMQDLRQG